MDERKIIEKVQNVSHGRDGAKMRELWLRLPQVNASDVEKIPLSGSGGWPVRWVRKLIMDRSWQVYCNNSIWHDFHWRLKARHVAR